MEFFETLWNDLKSLCGEEIILGDQPITTLNLIVWSLFIGFVIGVGVTIYNKFVLGSVVRGLVDRQAFTEGDALTTAEIGCSNVFVRFALRENGSMRRIVCMVGDTEAEKMKTPFSEARFYIPNEQLHHAEVVYGRAGANAVSVLLSVLAFLILVFISFTVIPDLIQMLTNFISSITPKSNIL